MAEFETFPEEIPVAESPGVQEAKPMKVETLDDIRRLMIIASGGDPEAQQTLNEFIKFGNNIERSNLPTVRDVVRVSYLDYAGKTLYSSFAKKNPFSLAAECMAIAFMAKNGDKSKQFVDLMKNTPSITDLQMLTQQPENPNRSFIDRALGRGKNE